MESTAIWGEYLKPVRSVADYQADNDKRDMNALQLAAARTEGQQKQQNAADRNAIRSLLAGGTDISTPEGQAALTKAAPLLAGPLLKTQAELAAARAKVKQTEAATGASTAKASRDQADATLKSLDLHRQMVGMLPDPQSAARYLTNAYSDPTTGPLLQHAGTLDELLARVPQDPEGFKAWQAKQAIGLDKIAQHVKVTSQNLGGTMETNAYNPLTGENTVVRSAPISVSPNTAANNTALAPLRGAQANAAGVNANANAARTQYETGTPVVSPDASSALPVTPPAGAPESPAAFPRIAPAQQQAMDGQATQIIAQKYLSNPAEMKNIDASIGQAQAALADRSLVPEQRGTLQRELAGMQMAKGGTLGAPVIASPVTPVTPVTPVAPMASVALPPMSPKARDQAAVAAAKAASTNANAGTKPLTDTQAKAAGFGARMTEANQVLAELDALGTQAGFPGAQNRAMNVFMSQNQQKLGQAKRNFVNSILRRESGAAISPSEFDSADKQYFPQVGDSPGVIAQKARNRQSAINGVLIEVPEAQRESAVRSILGTGAAPATASSGWKLVK